MLSESVVGPIIPNLLSLMFSPVANLVCTKGKILKLEGSKNARIFKKS